MWFDTSGDGIQLKKRGFKTRGDAVRNDSRCHVMSGRTLRASFRQSPAGYTDSSSPVAQSRSARGSVEPSKPSSAVAAARGAGVRRGLHLAHRARNR